VDFYKLDLPIISTSVISKNPVDIFIKAENKAK
jgi:hypothetical protein